MVTIGEDYKVVSEKKEETEDIQYRYGNSYIQIKEVFLKTDGGKVTGIMSGQLGVFVVVLHVYQEIENLQLVF